MELVHPTDPTKNVKHDSKGRKDFWGDHGREKSNSGGTWGWESIHPVDDVVEEGFVWEDDSLRLHIAVNGANLHTEISDSPTARSDAIEVINRGAERGLVGWVAAALDSTPLCISTPLPDDVSLCPPLVHAAKGKAEHHTKALSLLLERKANVDGFDSKGDTALIKVIDVGNHGSVKALVAAGASMTAKNDKGWTPLTLAAKLGDDAMVGTLVRDGGAPLVDVTGKFVDPIIEAANHGKCSTTVLLAKLKANVNVISAGRSALGILLEDFRDADDLASNLVQLISAGASIAECSCDRVTVQRAKLLAKMARRKKASAPPEAVVPVIEEPPIAEKDNNGLPSKSSKKRNRRKANAKKEAFVDDRGTHQGADEEEPIPSPIVEDPPPLDPPPKKSPEVAKKKTPPKSKKEKKEKKEAAKRVKEAILQKQQWGEKKRTEDEKPHEKPNDDTSDLDEDLLEGISMDDPSPEPELEDAGTEGPTEHGWSVAGKEGRKAEGDVVEIPLARSKAAGRDVASRPMQSPPGSNSRYGPAVHDLEIAETVNDDDSCPLCANDLDDTDLSFFPCKCKFQICLWCYQKVQEDPNLKGQCPACRTSYQEPVQIDQETVKARRKERERVRNERKLRKGREEQEQEAQRQLHSAQSSDSVPPAREWTEPQGWGTGSNLNTYSESTATLPMPVDRQQLEARQALNRAAKKDALRAQQMLHQRQASHEWGAPNTITVPAPPPGFEPPRSVLRPDEQQAWSGLVESQESNMNWDSQIVAQQQQQQLDDLLRSAGPPRALAKSRSSLCMALTTIQRCIPQSTRQGAARGSAMERGCSMRLGRDGTVSGMRQASLTCTWVTSWPMLHHKTSSSGRMLLLEAHSRACLSLMSVLQCITTLKTRAATTTRNPPRRTMGGRWQVQSI